MALLLLFKGYIYIKKKSKFEGYFEFVRRLTVVKMDEVRASGYN